MSAVKLRQARRVKPSTDQQVEEMLSDPTAYFSKARAEARAEARLYVAQRERSARARSARTAQL